MRRKKKVSGIHSHLGYWLRTVSNAVSHSFARKLDAEGITVAEWVFLRTLYDAERISPSLLAERMGMTKGAISKLADRLVEKSFVMREANPEGKRGQSLAIESAGRTLVPRLAALADDNDAAFFHALSQRERRQLERLLRKIVSARDLKNVPID